MSNGGYLGIDDKARNTIKGYLGIDDKARRLIKGYVGVDGVSRLCWEAGAEEEAVPTDCLTFSSDEAFTIAQTDDFQNWEGTLCYSTDAEAWNEWDGTTTIGSAEHYGKQRIYMRGSGNVRISGSAYQFTGNPWVITGNSIRCIGNIENLLDYEAVARGEHPVMDTYCFASMFYNCSALIEAPELPGTTLAQFCYWGMFWGSGITQAPELPASTMVNACYANMFSNCLNLATAPALPATTLANQCYANMFVGCDSLTESPNLPSTTLATNCYSAMFRHCDNLSVIPKLPADILQKACYYEMFKACPCVKLSETQTDEYQLAYRIPATGEGTAGDRPFNNMFADTGGTFTGTPEINKTYYTSNRVV